MRKQKDIFYGIVLYLCINVITSFIIGLNKGIFHTLDLSPYYEIGVELLIYAVILWFINNKLTSNYPKMDWKVFVGVLFVIVLNNSLLNYFTDNDFYYTEIEGFIALDGRVMLNKTFELFLLYFAYKMYSPSKDSQKDYIWYGAMIAILADIAYRIYFNITWSLISITSFNVIAQTSTTIILIILFLYLGFRLFYYIAGRRPYITGLFVICIVILQVLSNSFSSLISFSPLYNEGSPLFDSILKFSFNCAGGAFIYFIYFFAFVGYSRLNKKMTNVISKSKENINWIVKAILCSLLFTITTHLLFSFSISHASYRQTLSQAPSKSINHFPFFTMQGYGSSYDENGNQCAIYLTREGKSAVRDAQKTLAQNKFLAQYQPSDPNLEIVETNYENEINSKRLQEKAKQSYFPLFYSPYMDDSENAKLTDYEIYVINAKPLDVEQVWEEGYSCGIYINKSQQKVIYWVLYW